MDPNGKIDSPSVATTAFPSQAAIEQETVLAPPATKSAKPGHLWGGTPGQGSHLKAAVSLPAAQPEDPGQVFLVQLRADMISKLSWQEEILNEILRKLDRPRGPPPPSLVAVAPAPIHNEKEVFIKKEKSDKSHGTNASGASGNVPEPRKTTFTPGAPHLFSTFTHYDLALQDVANIADGKKNRLRFARTKAEVGPEEEMTCSVRIVGHPAFDAFCALVVISNSIFLGMEVQLGISNYAEGLPLGMSVASYVYTAWFLLELLLRLKAEGRNFLFNADWAWSLLDIFVVLTSIWEVAAEIVYAMLQNDIGEVAGMSGLKALRIIRITRVVKVVRLMRVFRFVMAFRTLITSIADTLKSLFWALMLLIVIVYVFAVLFAQAVNDYVLDPESPPLPDRESLASDRYYASLSDTMLSLFMCVSGGVNWSEVMAPLPLISPIWALLFLFFICFTYFAVLNVVTGVFCQTAIESAQNDQTAVVHSILKNKQAHIDKIRNLFTAIGDDKTGVITFAMFEEQINSPAVKAYFEVLGLDVWDAWSFFKLLDLDDGGDVEIEEFLMGCLRLRGTARAIDVGKLIHDQTWLMRTHGKFQTYVEVELKKIQEQLVWLAGCYGPGDGTSSMTSNFGKSRRSSHSQKNRE
mmetsp:Transcript_12991/g.30901  ORF Transcript_12991/g.30901 Transcript_12991/m.30901 type:complete len:636 (+) Transcript_12991:61-1968(+)